jgi:hypothetical protein
VDASGEETDSVRAAIDDPWYQPWYQTERTSAHLSVPRRLDGIADLEAVVLVEGVEELSVGVRSAPCSAHSVIGAVQATQQVVQRPVLE